MSSAQLDRSVPEWAPHSLSKPGGTRCRWPGWNSPLTLGRWALSVITCALAKAGLINMAATIYWVLCTFPPLPSLLIPSTSIMEPIPPWLFRAQANSVSPPPLLKTLQKLLHWNKGHISNHFLKVLLDMTPLQTFFSPSFPPSCFLCFSNTILSHSWTLSCLRVFVCASTLDWNILCDFCMSDLVLHFRSSSSANCLKRSSSLGI